MNHFALAVTRLTIFAALDRYNHKNQTEMVLY